jgi:hypothetical protein
MSYFLSFGASSRIPRIDNYAIYWREIVTQDYREFLRNDDDLRRAFHCAASLFHMHDWLYVTEESAIKVKYSFKDQHGVAQSIFDPGSFANVISDIHADFELIRGVANSGKHLQLTPRRNTPLRHPSMPSNAANTYFSISTVQLGPLSWTSGEIMLAMPTPPDRSLVDIATSVYEFWQTFCTANGWLLA